MLLQTLILNAWKSRCPVPCLCHFSALKPLVLLPHKFQSRFPDSITDDISTSTSDTAVYDESIKTYLCLFPYCCSAAANHSLLSIAVTTTVSGAVLLDDGEAGSRTSYCISIIVIPRLRLLLDVWCGRVLSFLEYCTSLCTS